MEALENKLAIVRDNTILDAGEKKRRTMKKVYAMRDESNRLFKKNDVPLRDIINAGEYLDNKAKSKLLWEQAAALEKSAWEKYSAASKEAEAAYETARAALKK